MTHGLMPGVTHKLIPPGVNDPPIVPIIAILHVAVSKAESLYEFFRFRSGGIESHFYINWRGKIEQYRNIFWEADANFRANSMAVSIETAGFGPGWWNPLQKKAIKEVLLWLNDETNGGIPLRVCPSAFEPGVGYHVQFGSPGPWTPVAKSCPGGNRIKQFNRWLTPWLDSNPQEEEMLTRRDKKWIKKAMREVVLDSVAEAPVNKWGPEGGTPKFRNATVGSVLKDLARQLPDAEGE